MVQYSSLADKDIVCYSDSDSATHFKVEVFAE